MTPLRQCSCCTITHSAHRKCLPTGMHAVQQQSPIPGVGTVSGWLLQGWKNVCGRVIVWWFLYLTTRPFMPWLAINVHCSHLEDKKLRVQLDHILDEGEHDYCWVLRQHHQLHVSLWEWSNVQIATVNGQQCLSMSQVSQLKLSEQVENGTVLLTYCRSENMIADMYAKGLHSDQFVRLRNLAGVLLCEKECWDRTHEQHFTYLLIDLLVFLFLDNYSTTVMEWLQQ